ncbi:hypothetical protein [Yersinia intermedia]|uniref:hypothetical protein n=1 Tax=Yersinia intermedia TaxID=631 RepID=UPI0012D3AAAA|nr:hypothetical protein [Yersinia intermedia]
MTQQGMPVYTVNGRSGIKVGTGIVLIPANGQFSGQVSIARKTYSGSASTSSLGSLQLSNAYSGPSNWCVQNVPASSPSGIRNTGFYAGNFSLSWYVYVDPSVAVGTIASVPTFYVSRSIAGSGWGVAKSIAANISGYQIKVTSTTCTLSTPSQIQFGTIDAGSTAPVISSDSGLDISCNGVAPTVNVSYTAQAVSATQTPTQLVMSNTQNQTLGMVRGFIGTNADSEVGCNDAVTSLKFGAPATNLLTAAANNTAHKIPLKWVLCPSSYAVPGQGVASATLDIIWQ